MNPDGSATSQTFALRAKDEGKLSVDGAPMTNSRTSIVDASRFVLYEIQNLAIIRLDPAKNKFTIIQKRRNIISMKNNY
jgi:hypothetical protein